MRSSWRDRVREYQTRLDNPTTVHLLAEALRSNRMSSRSSADNTPVELHTFIAQSSVDCDEVFPRVFIGDGYTAKNIAFLKKKGITHVLNTAEGKLMGMVNTDSRYYIGSGIKYLGLCMLDLPSTNISQYFYTAANFIHDALQSGGSVYVHCVQGVSRSPTCVIAYLMIKHKMPAADAIRMIRRSRGIYPNAGFLQQLATLDNQLRSTRISY